MGQINVMVAGRPYSLSCRDGEEARLARLCELVHAKAQDLHQSLGQMSEARTLLMSAILLADELSDMREKLARTPAFTPLEEHNRPILEQATLKLEALAAKI
jgi:cell division protein ZapA